MRDFVQIVGVVCLVICALVAPIGGFVCGLAWVCSSFEAKALSELTGREITTSQVFWAGSHIKFEVEAQRENNQ